MFYDEAGCHEVREIDIFALRLQLYSANSSSYWEVCKMLISGIQRPLSHDANSSTIGTVYQWYVFEELWYFFFNNV